MTINYGDLDPEQRLALARGEAVVDWHAVALQQAARADKLQSELTKARELLTTGRSVVRGSEYKVNGGIAWLYGVENFLTHQSTPAAKGG